MGHRRQLRLSFTARAGVRRRWSLTGLVASFVGSVRSSFAATSVLFTSAIWASLELVMTTGETAQAVESDADAIERWFVQRGVPQAIFHYNAAEDVLTRMVPYLTAVFLLGALAGFGDKFTGWGQFGVALAAFVILMGFAVGINRFRGRRNFELPDDVAFSCWGRRS